MLKCWLGFYILGDFFTNSTADPGQQQALFSQCKKRHILQFGYLRFGGNLVNKIIIFRIKIIIDN
jgi:hypothetical protein